jgi:hypothetical protein
MNHRLPNHGFVPQVFDYYCIIGNLVGKAAFAIGENAYLQMLKECEVPDARITIEECGKIFIIVNFEEEKQTVQSEVNEDKALMRFELLEVFVRIAVAKFLGTKRHRKPPSTCTTVARLQLIAKRFGSCAGTATSARAAAGRDGGDGAGGSIDVDDDDDAAAEAEAAEAKAKAEIAEKEEEEDLGLIDDVSECLELLFAHIERWLPPETTTDEDIFRRGRLYCEEVPGKRKMIYISPLYATQLRRPA